MTALRQVVRITTLSLLSIPARAGACAVTVIGVAGAVAVLICVFAMARGFAEVAAKAGRPDRAIVLGAGAEAEGGSSLSHDAVAKILDAPQIARTGDGHPIASADYIAFARLSDPHTGLDTFATVRGIGAQGLVLHREIKLVAGRSFDPAAWELIVGTSLQRRLGNLQLGQYIWLPQGQWKIVGSFESEADSHQSEFLGGADTLRSAYESASYNSVTVMLNHPGDFASFRRTLSVDPTLSVVVLGEREYLLEASKPTRRLLGLIAYFVGGIMALGASFATLNGMFSAIDARLREVATLRAIGYDAPAVIASVFVEALLLALVGAALGASAAWWFFSGSSVSTLSGTNPAPVTYVLNVNGPLVVLALACACGIGLVGGLFPAIRTARRSVAVALKGA